MKQRKQNRGFPSIHPLNAVLQRKKDKHKRCAGGGGDAIFSTASIVFESGTGLAHTPVLTKSTPRWTKSDADSTTDAPSPSHLTLLPILPTEYVVATDRLLCSASVFILGTTHITSMICIECCCWLRSILMGPEKPPGMGSRLVSH